MAFIIKLLGAGVTNSASAKQLYSAPSTISGAIVNNVRLVNPGGTNLTVNLFYKPATGGSIRLLGLNHTVSASACLVVKPELTLGPSDVIEVTTSAQMDYVVSGMEKA